MRSLQCSARPRAGHGLAVFLLATALGVVTAAAVAPVAAQQSDAQRDMAKGAEYLQKGEPDKAINEFAKVLNNQETFAPAHFVTGMAYAQMQQYSDAYTHLNRATELQPGNGEWHEQACRTAWFGEDFDNAWRQCILAAQAGRDVAAAFPELAKASAGPSDYQQRIAAPRIWVAAPDIEALLGRDDGVFDHVSPTQQAGADQRGAGADSSPAGAGAGGGGRGFSDPSSRFSAESGNSVAAQVQADLAEVRRRFSSEIAISDLFGLVVDQGLADYVMVVEVDDVGTESPRVLTGYVKLIDVTSGEEAYSRPLQLDNISSISDLQNDISRYVGYLEQWRRENAT